MRRPPPTRKRTLVTGGTGYIGSAVVDELLAQGQFVRVLDSLLHSARPPIPEGASRDRIDLVVGDILDPEARQRALAGMDEVVHLAAIVGDPACARAPKHAWAVNVDATCGLLEEAEAAGIERFVFASTCSNYGRMTPDKFATEESELQPVSLYAESKVAAEQHVLMRSESRVSRCCLRFATAYGVSRRMRFDLTVNEFTRDAFRGGELTVYGEQFWRPYVHVRDIARAVHTVLEASPEVSAGEVFNVGATHENYRKRDLVALVLERFPQTEVTFVHKDEDPRDYRVNFEKFTRQLAFAVERTVRDGVDEVSALLDAGVLGDPYASAYRN